MEYTSTEELLDLCFSVFDKVEGQLLPPLNSSDEIYSPSSPSWEPETKTTAATTIAAIEFKSKDFLDFLEAFHLESEKEPKKRGKNPNNCGVKKLKK